MKKGILLIIGLMVLVGCASVDWHNKLQMQYFDKDGKLAGYSGSWPCVKQAMKETGHSIIFEFCNSDPKCKDLAETCMEDKGYIEAKMFETTEERITLYRRAYEEGWIKPGMTRLEVINLLGAPQIVTYQLIPPRKIWMYCRSATKTALIGFNFVLQITWSEDRVESIEKKFII